MEKRRSWCVPTAFIVLAISMMILGFFSCGTKSQQTSRPNILLILADDLGYNDIASWGDGAAPTPRIDQLSSESLRFTRFYADSTCSPSRASLITGQHPVSLGFQPVGAGISQDVDTIAKSLSVSGYYTAHIGKWHVGELINNPQILPNALGFDYYFGFANQFMLRGGMNSNPPRQSQPTYNDPWLQENSAPYRQYLGSLDDILVDKAVEVVRKKQTPWFINLWIMSPHTPYQPSSEAAKRFPDTEEGRYLAVLNQLDSNVGRLMDVLSEEGQLENTVIVFLSDNGNVERFRKNNYPLVGGKGTYNEGGVRVPLFIYWPLHVKSGSIDNPASLLDIYPTLLDLAGGRANSRLVGTSLVNSDLLSHDRKSHDIQVFSMRPEPPLTFFSVYDHAGQHAYDYALGKQKVRELYDFHALGRSQSWQINEERYSNFYSEWERKVRPVPLSYQIDKDGYATLTGRELQRSPVYGEYSIGAGLIPLENTAAVSGEIFKQEGLWSLSMESSGRLHFQYANSNIYSEKISIKEGCNSLVLSIYVRPRTYGYMAQKEASRAAIYINGKAVLDSDLPLSAPVEDYGYLENPTFVGGGASTSRFRGKVTKPVVVGKFLGSSDVGYNMSDMAKESCGERGGNE